MSRLPDASTRKVLGAGTLRRYSPGTKLMQEGSTSGVFLVVRGKVKLTAVSDNGVETCLDYLGRGELVGVETGFDAGPHVATATAVTLLQGRFFSRDEFHRLLEDQDVAAAAGHSLVEQLRRATRRRVEFSSYPVRTRVARVLLDLLERRGDLPPAPDSELPTVEITQGELGGLVGATEVSVQRALKELRDSGAVRTAYRSMTVEPDALRRFAT